jgi:hypothetical protein
MIRSMILAIALLVPADALAARAEREMQIERRAQMLEGVALHGKDLRQMSALSMVPRYCSSCHHKSPLTEGNTGGGRPPQVIPLPATALLLGAGFAAIAAATTKRKR